MPWKNVALVLVPQGDEIKVVIAAVIKAMTSSSVAAVGGMAFAGDRAVDGRIYKY